MNDTTYNGWTNWATWNANLWVDNEESTYKDRIRIQRGFGDWSKESAKEFFLGWFPKGTPDMDSSDIDEIDWNDIVESWNEEDC